MSDLHFWLFLLVGGSAVAAAVGMLLLRNAVYSALCLIYIMGALALLFLMLDAPFLALVQVTVYAGAVMVLFLFVMMLLGNQAISAGEREIRGLPLIASVGATVFILAAGLAIQSGEVDEEQAPLPAPQLRVANFDPLVAAGAELRLRLNGQPVGDGLGYGEISESQTLTAGAQQLALLGEDGTAIYADAVRLAAGETVSLLIHRDAAGNIKTARLLEDSSHVGLRESRLAIVNLSGGPLAVYDTGRDRALDPARDTLWAAGLADGAISEARTSERGRRELAFVDEAGEIALRTPELELAGGQSALLVIASDEDGRAVWRYFPRASEDPFGSPAAVGQSLFRRFLLPFEMIGVLLLAALVGGIIIAQGQRREVRRRDVRRRVARTLGAAIGAQTGAESSAGRAAQLPAAEGDGD